MAGYLKPFLPTYLELPVLAQIDRIWFIDKEIRKNKGRWEKRILRALNQQGTDRFRKRTFEVRGNRFEIDAASPEVGAIQLGVDIKRIEARRDIHKRCDEIMNKAREFKSAFPKARFAAVVYYPFLDEQINVQSRLSSQDIDGLVFASESADAIGRAVELLLSKLGASAR